MFLFVILSHIANILAKGPKTYRERREAKIARWRKAHLKGTTFGTRSRRELRVWFDLPRIISPLMLRGKLLRLNQNKD